jgi:epsilon-lactone hydrolase
MSSASPNYLQFHEATARDRAATAQTRSALAPLKGKLRGVGARAPFADIMGHVAAPEGVAFRPDTIGGIAGWWCEPAGARPDAVILHIHGGAFNWGSAESFRHFGGQIARAAKTRVFLPEYRLAPENPFPAAIDDVWACYQGLVKAGARAIALSGDSAGGNLALLLLARLKAQAASANVVGAAVLSPVTDLAQTGESWQSRAEADPIFVREQVGELAHSYLAGRDPKNPEISPLYGDLKGLPPIRVDVGDDEVLLDDSLRYVARAVAAGVDARVDVWEAMPHGFIGSVGQLDAASEALASIGAFFSARFADGLSHA